MQLSELIAPPQKIRMLVKPRIVRITSLILIAIPVILYFWVVVKYALNVPNWDDYDAVFKFLFDLSAAPSFKDKLRIMFAQHNEHRIVFDRIVILLNKLVGRINFKVLIYFGNLALIFIISIFFIIQPSGRHKLLYFIPVPFLILQLQNYQNTVWAMASIQNYYVILFALASIYLLSKDSWRSFVVSACFAILAVYTSGNGMIIFPVGFILLILTKANIEKLLIWSVCGTIATGSYFIGYLKIPGHRDVAVTLLDYPDQLVSHFLFLLGSCLQFINQAGALFATMLGFIIVVLFFFTVQQGCYKSNVPLFYFLLFLLLSTAATSVSRSGFGVHQAFDSRYKIYSLLITATLYIIFLNIIPPKVRVLYLITASLLSMILYYGSFKHYIEIVDGWSNNFARETALYNLDKPYGTLSFPRRELAEPMLVQAINEGLYQLPDLSSVPVRCKIEEIALPRLTNDITHYIDNLIGENAGPYLKVTGWAAIKGVPSEENEISVVLSSTAHTYAITAQPNLREDVTTYFKLQGRDSTNVFKIINYDYSGFFTFISKQDIAPGEYQVGILISKADGRRAFQLINRRVIKTEDL